MARLYVKGLSSHTTRDDLNQIFTGFGKIESIKTGSGDFAFVTFMEEGSAQLAMRKLNGDIYDGKKLVIELAHGGKERDRERDRERERDTRSWKKERDLPEFRNGGDDQVCFNCKETGHFARDCTAPPRNPLYLDTRGTKVTDLYVHRDHPYERRDSMYRDQIPRSRREYRDTREYREIRDPRDPRDVRDPREPRDIRDPRDVRDPRDPREPRDVRDLRDIRDLRERDYREIREYGEREPRDLRDIRDIRDRGLRDRDLRYERGYIEDRARAYVDERDVDLRVAIARPSSSYRETYDPRYERAYARSKSDIAYPETYPSRRYYDNRY